MAKNFFVAWQTWEKLVFILACAIVVTVMLGCIKLAHIRCRLRKYTGIEHERREQAMHRQSSHRHDSTGQDDIPFGIRALESGIEVEGVWISRSNTPEIGTRDTSATVSLWDGSVGGKQSDPYQPRTTMDSRSEIISHRTWSNVPIQVPAAVPVRSRHPPISFARYHGNPYALRRQSCSTSTLESLDEGFRRENCQTGESTNVSRKSSIAGGTRAPRSASASSILTTDRRQSSASSDLELLDSHRLSQAAETGQLTPRVPMPGKVYSRQPASGFSQEQLELWGQFRDASSRLKGRSKDASPFPKVENSARRNTMPDVISFTEFCKLAPPSPPPPAESQRRKSSLEAFESTITQKRVPAAVESAAALDQAIRHTESERPDMPFPAPARAPSFERWTPQIVRGHGTGFEILKPGTLNHPRSSWGEGTGPIAIPGASHRRSSSGEGRRKLQKHRRQSSVSVASSATSEVSLACL